MIKGKNYFFLIFLLLLSSCSYIPDIDDFLPGTSVVKKQTNQLYNKPYKVKGKRYFPNKYYEYEKTGIASHYGKAEHGNFTATGEYFSANGLTAAHKTLPLPAIVRVTNLENGLSILVRVNDRGPFIDNRVIDVSSRVAKILGFKEQGLTKVRVKCLVHKSISLANNYRARKCNPYKLDCGGAYKIPQKLHHHRKHKSINLRKLSRMSIIAKPKIHYFVQAGIYKTRMRAKIFAQATARKLQKSYKISNITLRGKRAYKILFGPLDNIKIANKILFKSHKLGIRDAYIVTQKNQ